MKKLLFLVVIIITLTSISFANENIDVLINPELSIHYDIQDYNFYDALGNNVYPITYNDSTYLPIRALSSLFKKGITWVGENKTIILGEGDIDAQAARREACINQKAFPEQAIKSTEIKVIYNGESQTFKDANGVVVYPILFNGTTYLPVRALSNLFEASITWEGETKSINIYSKDFSDSTDDPIEEKPKSSTGFASLAEETFTTYKGHVHKINDLNGTLYYKYIDTYAGQKAQDIISGTPDSTRSAFNVSKMIEDDEMYFVAVFEVDTSEHKSILGDEASFIDLMPAMDTKVAGYMNGDVYSRVFDSTNSYNGGVFLSDAEFYKIGDIVNLYYVYPMKKDFEPMAITYSIADFTEKKYKTFSHSFLFETIEKGDIDSSSKVEEQPVEELSGIYKNSKGETIRIASVSDKLILGAIDNIHYEEEHEKHEILEAIYAEQGLKCVISKSDIEKLIEFNADIVNLEDADKDAELYFGVYETSRWIDSFTVIDSYKLADNGKKLISQKRGTEYDFVITSSSYSFKDYIKDSLYPFGIFSFNDGNSYATFKVMRCRNTDMAFVVMDCNFSESEYYVPCGTGLYSTAVGVDIAIHESEHSVIFGYSYLYSYEPDRGYGILEMYPLKDEYGHSNKENKKIQLEKQELLYSEMESEFINAIKELEESDGTIYIHHNYET